MRFDEAKDRTGDLADKIFIVIENQPLENEQKYMIALMAMGRLMTSLSLAIDISEKEFEMMIKELAKDYKHHFNS